MSGSAAKMGGFCVGAMSGSTAKVEFEREVGSPMRETAGIKRAPGCA